MAQCSKCKEEINEGALKCPHCGSTINTQHNVILGFLVFASLMELFREKIANPIEKRLGIKGKFWKALFWFTVPFGILIIYGLVHRLLVEHFGITW